MSLDSLALALFYHPLESRIVHGKGGSVHQQLYKRQAVRIVTATGFDRNATTREIARRDIPSGTKGSRSCLTHVTRSWIQLDLGAGMHSPGISRSALLLLAMAAISAIGLIALVAYSATSTPGDAGGPVGPVPVAANPPAATQIDEEEAHRLVWTLPEVMATAERLRAQGSRPITITVSLPDPAATPGTQEAAYFIRLSEDQGETITAVETFAVDSFTRQISVYNVAEGRRMTLEEWRGRGGRY